MISTILNKMETAADEQDKGAWPILPLLALGGVFAATQLAGVRYKWAADFGALMIAFSFAQASIVLTQSRPMLGKSTWHWLPNLVGTVIGVLLATAYQAAMWPPLATPHDEGIAAGVLCTLTMWFTLPQILRSDARRRANALYEKRLTEERTGRQLLEARMAALQGQIEPHFLYNTLANVRALIRQDAGSAENMLNQLNAYLRAAMPDLRTATTLGQELERAQAYLTIMQIRHGARLRFRIDATGEARACPIPPLAVMTLVENALAHGIEPKPAGGEVTIAATCDGGRLTITVQDDGVGMQAEIGSGIGLLNLQERLQTLHGDAAELRIEPAQPCGVKASIGLPLRRESAT